MDESRSSLNRVRAILKVMDQSIEDARQKRLDDADESSKKDDPPSRASENTREQTTEKQKLPVQRLKAKPKRPGPTNNGSNGFSSRAI